MNIPKELIAIFASLTLMLVVGCGPEAPKGKPSKYAPIGVKIVCLNGVEYWKDDDRDMRSESLAPKYSPGKTTPDECEAE